MLYILGVTWSMWFPNNRSIFVSSSHVQTPLIHYIILRPFLAHIFFTSEFNCCNGQASYKAVQFCLHYRYLLHCNIFYTLCTLLTIHVPFFNLMTFKVIKPTIGMYVICNALIVLKIFLSVTLKWDPWGVTSILLSFKPNQHCSINFAWVSFCHFLVWSEVWCSRKSNCFFVFP